ncbi:MAG TPA: hypothetical protein VGQ92_20225 [Actinoplanes sp.]|jgi:hypothetical protein|nr:hypothetical protein [Actinoplanes sp.]
MRRIFSTLAGVGSLTAAGTSRSLREALGWLVAHGQVDVGGQAF